MAECKRYPGPHSKLQTFGLQRRSTFKTALAASIPYTLHHLQPTSLWRPVAEEMSFVFKYIHHRVVPPSIKSRLKTSSNVILHAARHWSCCLLFAIRSPGTRVGRCCLWIKRKPTYNFKKNRQSKSWTRSPLLVVPPPRSRTCCPIRRGCSLQHAWLPNFRCADVPFPLVGCYGPQGVQCSFTLILRDQGQQRRASCQLVVDWGGCCC